MLISLRTLFSPVPCVMLCWSGVGWVGWVGLLVATAPREDWIGSGIVGCLFRPRKIRKSKLRKTENGDHTFGNYRCALTNQHRLRCQRLFAKGHLVARLRESYGRYLWHRFRHRG